jgi:hypothetical protein
LNDSCLQLTLVVLQALCKDIRILVWSNE